MWRERKGFLIFILPQPGVILSFLSADNFTFVCQFSVKSILAGSVYESLQQLRNKHLIQEEFSLKIPYSRAG